MAGQEKQAGHHTLHLHVLSTSTGLLTGYFFTLPTPPPPPPTPAPCPPPQLPYPDPIIYFLSSLLFPFTPPTQSPPHPPPRITIFRRWYSVYRFSDSAPLHHRGGALLHRHGRLELIRGTLDLRSCRSGPINNPTISIPPHSTHSRAPARRQIIHSVALIRLGPSHPSRPNKKGGKRYRVGRNNPPPFFCTETQCYWVV
jgi:hypothetical protein